MVNLWGYVLEVMGSNPGRLAGSPEVYLTTISRFVRMTRQYPENTTTVSFLILIQSSFIIFTSHQMLHYHKLK